jgi:hypothetical protein
VSVKDCLIDLIDEAYSRQSWHGPNLRGALRGVSEAEAAWRPARGRHSIRELTVHCAFWKFMVRRRLTGELDLAFRLPGRDWFETDPSRSWARELRLLASEHTALRAAVAAFPSARLTRPLLKNGRSAAYLVRGIAAHDLYHAGQVQLLKRMVRSR